MDSGKVSRRDVIRHAWNTAVGLAVISGARLSAASLDIRNHYSPRNRVRPKRPYTWYIVLHTTEGGETGSLRKVWRRGETHYFVTKNGRVYRVVDKSKIATHAGRSMWDGHGPIDNYSIGIEVVGYHDHDITDAQYRAVRELLRQLQSLYKIPDKNVLTHSMVAYGRPNRFYPFNHRGRKRCGMIFARPDVRKRLGLSASPKSDPDVRAGRLKIADLALQQYLYHARSEAAPGTATQVADSGAPSGSDGNVITARRTAWYIARDQYDSPHTVYIFPDGTRQPGDEITDWGRMPVGTTVLVSQEDESSFEGFVEAKEGESGRTIAGEAFASETTIYLLPSGMVRTGHDLHRRRSTRRLLEALPAGTRVLVGYIYGGHVKRNRLPSRIAGRKWNYPSTFYRLPDGTILSGDEIDDSQIPPNTLVLFQS
jgi:N-acetylmuramoyl-L-alanine amidase